jgi:hypothetical protein
MNRGSLRSLARGFSGTFETDQLKIATEKSEDGAQF